MKLFVYGSLLCPETVEALIHINPEYQTDYLRDYRVVKLAGLPYPGMIKSTGNLAEGAVIEIEDKSLKIISAWEDDEYELTKVVLESGIHVKTFVHIRSELWTDENWNRSEFEQKYLNDYVTTRIPNFLESFKNIHC